MQFATVDFLVGRHVDLHATADLDAHLRIKIRGQYLLVELAHDGFRPGTVEAVPVPLLAERRMKMVQKEAWIGLIEIGTSRQHRLHHLAMHVGQPILPALEADTSAACGRCPAGAGSSPGSRGR